MKPLTIGKLARKAGVGVETIRYYERIGLIEQPPRRISGYSEYPEEAVAILRFIRKAKELGFTLREIKELLALRLSPQSRCADVRNRAEAKIKDIDERICSLQKMRTALVKLTAACKSRRSIEECPIIGAMED